MKIKYNRQRGAALFTALMFLIIITMLSLAAMRSSVLALHMASNQELKNTAFQRAQAVVDSALADSGNMPTLGQVDATNCLAGDTDPDCTTKGVVLADSFLSTETDLFDGDASDGEVTARVKRLAPLEAPAPRAIGTSASIYSVATFQVSGSYDMTPVGQGGAQIVEGVMVLISK